MDLKVLAIGREQTLMLPRFNQGNRGSLATVALPDLQRGLGGGGEVSLHALTVPALEDTQTTTSELIVKLNIGDKEKMLSKRQILTLCTVAACLGLLFAAQTKADTTDPATLHIGPGAGTVCAIGCGGDPNLLGTGNTVDIYQNSGGAPDLSDPLFLILGVPNNSAAPSISGSVTFYNPYSGYPGNAVTGSPAFAIGGSTQWGMNTGTSGYFGNMSSGDVYSFLNLPGNNSNSFTNWANFDSTHNGITASDFGIYVFELSGADLGANGLVNVTGLSVPQGTYAVGWGCTTDGNNRCRNGNTYATPFTEAGFVDGPPVPEPGSLALLGSGLLALGGALRRRLIG